MNLQRIMNRMAERLASKNIPSNLQNLLKSRCFGKELNTLFTIVRDELSIQ